jgi:ribosomal protein S18 acetylase RimI-like enzyme
VIASLNSPISTVSISIRPARREDARDIVDLVCSAFEPNLLACLSYGCTGADRFVQQQIEAGSLGGDTIYAVAKQHDRTVGFAEIRILTDALFLNYICVRRDVRSTRVGTLLLRTALKYAVRAGRDRVVLDVFEHNDVAARWYERLGFEPTGFSDWWSIDLDGTSSSPQAILIKYPEAEASHAMFGFSQFELVSVSGRYLVGRLGDDWFRLNQLGALSDPAIRAALARIDPNRRILAVLEDRSLPESLRAAARPLVRTVRMEQRYAALMDRLCAFEVPNDDCG